MSTLAWVAVVWSASAPLALFWAWRYGFFPPGDPILAFRVPAVIWIGPAIALVALGSGLVALLAARAGNVDLAGALAWWREESSSNG